jgi:hypothetical protein
MCFGATHQGDAKMKKYVFTVMVFSLALFATSGAYSQDRISSAASCWYLCQRSDLGGNVSEHVFLGSRESDHCGCLTKVKGDTSDVSHRVFSLSST